MNDPKKQMSDYYEELRNRVLRLGNKLAMLQCSIDAVADERKLKAWNEFPMLFGHVEESLRTDIIVTLANLFDERRSERNVIDFLNKTKDYLPGIMGRMSEDKLKLLRKDIDSQIGRVRAVKPLTDSIKFSRDKYYAHSEGKYFDEPAALITEKPLKFQDVVKVVELCRSLLNWVEAKIFDCPVSYWGESEGTDELDRLLCYIRRYLRMCDEVGKKLGPSELLEMIKP